MNNWADSAIKDLKAGKVAVLYPKGNSMIPKIESGAKVILSPIANLYLLQKDDIVLVAINNKVFLHLISDTDSNRVQISNNQGLVNGWVGRQAVYGRVVFIENPIKEEINEKAK